MGELYNEIVSLQQDRESMGALARACHITDLDEAGMVFTTAVETVIAGLSDMVESGGDTEGLVATARALSWSERSNPGELMGNPLHRVGVDAVEKIFGTDTAPVTSHLVASTGIATVGATPLLSIASQVTMATMVGTGRDDFGADVLVDAVRGERDVVANRTPQAAAAEIDAPASAADESASQQPAAEPTSEAAAPSSASSSKSTAEPASDGKSKQLVAVVAGVVALLAVVGIVAATGGGDDDPESEIAAEGDDPDDDGVTVTTVSQTTDDGAEDPEEDADLPFASSDDGGVVSLRVPMVDVSGTSADASGTLAFDFNTVTGEVCYAVDSVNIEGPYRSHIHVGGAGVKGGIVVDLGPLESGATGCVDNLPVDTNAILGDRAGHYAELHDVSEEWTIRGQLSEAINPADPSGDIVVDTDGGGARTVLDSGTIYLEGDVPDQQTADELVASLDGVDADTPVVNNLRVVTGAPLPSGRVIIADAIFFDVNSDEVKQIGATTLSAITALAESREDWILTVVGHTDSSGSDVYNLELSLRRATALRDLLAGLGIPDENLRIQGAGETAPIGDNTTAEGRAQNRRIEFEFTPQ